MVSLSTIVDAAFRRGGYTLDADEVAVVVTTLSDSGTVIGNA